MHRDSQRLQKSHRLFRIAINPQMRQHKRPDQPAPHRPLVIRRIPIARPAGILPLITRLTRRHEAAAARPWAVTDAPPEYINGQLKAIVGVEVTITEVEAKDKLSQNRSTLDQAGVVTGLRDIPGPGPAAIAGLMAANLEAGAQPE